MGAGGAPARYAPGLILAAMLLLPLALGWAAPGPDLAAYPWFYRRDNRPLWVGEPLAEVVLVGDVMLGRGVSAQPAPLGAAAPWLQAADLALGNLEGVLADESPLAGPVGGGAAGEPFPLLVPSGRVADLQRAGFDLLGLANNHALDLGPAGLAGSYRDLQGAGITPLGAGPDPGTAWQPAFRTVHGVRLAFVAFNAVPHLRQNGGGWAPAAFDAPGLMMAALRTAREQSEAVIVSVHWGYEFQAQVDPAQEALARSLFAAGADLVVGHHPHVVQKVQVISGEKAGRRPGVGVVAYSLGNFAFDQYGPQAGQGLALRAFFDRRGLRAVQALPVGAGLQPRLLPPHEAAVAVEGLLAPHRLAFACNEDTCWQVSPAPGDRSGRFQSGALDLTGDGRPEHIRLAGTQAVIIDQGEQVWQSPVEWQVRDLALGDPNDDGRGELLLAVDKGDSQGVPRSHPFIVGQRGGQYRLLWGGSAVSNVILEVDLEDVDGDGVQELVVLEEAGPPGAAALAVWDWHGWGFSLQWRGEPGYLYDLEVSQPAGSEAVRIGVSSRGAVPE